MCKENTQYQLRVDSAMSEALEVRINLKRANAQSPRLALEKIIRKMQKRPTGITIEERKVQVLGFADNLNAWGSSLNDTKWTSQVLKKQPVKSDYKLSGKNEDNEIIRQLREYGWWWWRSNFWKS